MTGSFLLVLCWSGGSAIMCARLEDDGHVVEEFELSLWLAAGRDIWRGTTLVTTVHFKAAFFRLLSQVEVV
jgi:hypothetical protein